MEWANARDTDFIRDMAGVDRSSRVDSYTVWGAGHGVQRVQREQFADKG